MMHGIMNLKENNPSPYRHYAVDVLALVKSLICLEASRLAHKNIRRLTIIE